MGEPTDVMCESIMQDAAKTGCKRIIAIGGGTVIDIAKLWQLLQKMLLWTACTV